MIQKYKRYDTWLSRSYNIASGSTALIATLGKLVEGFGSAPVLLISSSIVALIITKIRDVFKFGEIVSKCKEQIVKYETLYQKILIINTDFQVDSIKETLQSLKDFDMEINHEILTQFDETCKKNGIRSASNDVDKLKALDTAESQIYAFSPPERTEKINNITVDEMINNITYGDSQTREGSIIRKDSGQQEVKLTVSNTPALETRTNVDNINLDKDLKESIQRFSNLSSISLERLEKIKANKQAEND